LGIPPAMFKDVLKRYRQDVPAVGTVSPQRVDELLAEGRICRGWMRQEGGSVFFHVIRSPTAFPEKAILSAENEEDLLAMTAMMGMENSVDLEDMVADA